MAFIKNIKLPDRTYYKVKALQYVTTKKQYEIIDEMADDMAEKLSDRERSFYEDQIKKVQESAEVKG